MNKIQQEGNPPSAIRVDRATVNSLPLWYQAMAEVFAASGKVEIVEHTLTGGK